MTEWRWKDFTHKELSCPHCGAFILVESFLDKLQNLRNAYGKKMKVTSGYRCSTWNSGVSDTGKHGAHTLGIAVDIQVSGKDAFDLLHLALLHGFTGVGIKQHGPMEGRFLHLDTMKDAALRPRLWSYG